MPLGLGDSEPSFRIGDVTPFRIYLGDALVWSSFVPFAEVNVTRVSQPVPAGALQYRVRLRGAGGGGGTGIYRIFVNNASGAGGGGGGYLDTGWRPISDLGSTYNTATAPSRTPHKTDGGAVRFTSGAVDLWAYGGQRGETAVNSNPTAGGAGGAVSATVPLAVSENGGKGGDCTAGVFGDRSGSPGQSTNLAGPGGGGGAYHPNSFNIDLGGSGGSSAAASGGVGNYSNTQPGQDAGVGDAGGGGAGGGISSGNSRVGGDGGVSGGGGGGASSTQGSGKETGGEGAPGETIIEFA